MVTIRPKLADLLSFLKIKVFRQVNNLLDLFLAKFLDLLTDVAMVEVCAFAS